MLGTQGDNLGVLEFILGMTNSLVWPAAVVTCVVLLRNDISSLIRKIRRLKHKDTELDFERGLYEAIESAASQDELSAPVDKDDGSSELARLSPRGAIIESWLHVERSLKDYAERNGLEIDERKPFRLGRGFMQSLDYERLGKGVIETLRKLRVLRNEAVHLKDADLDYEDAEKYQQLSRRVIKVIDNA
ncbi:MAG: hypothetical protein V7667_03810 [Alloalcanivorax venustensis]|jgi:hypothetical protein|uniref:hypothetical protein n=1 Tax=Alloalcanivorax venustensis TaxID=172371 RepID=UPI002E9A4C6E|nr:hypothetical protein [Pseudomonadota bacterium]